MQEEVFLEFFKKLRDSNVPLNLVLSLQKLWEENRLESKESILADLKKETEDENKRKSN